MSTGPRVQLERELLRARILVVAMVVALAGLGAALWHVQVARGSEYQNDLENQSVRRARIPGMRGRILDRNGVVLADNRPSYCLAVYLEELRLIRKKGQSSSNQVLEVLAELESVVGRPPAVQEEDVGNHLYFRRPLPLIAWRDLETDEVARIAERATNIPGVDLFADAVRVYPERTSAAHVIGYVGRTNMQHHAERPYNYLAPEMIGKSGVEKRFDGVLRGRAGGRLLRIDVAGFRHEDLAYQEPESGSDVHVAIDLGVQNALERSVSDVEAAAVVIDARNGDVLALASSPAYDGNMFVPFITSEAWRSVTNNAGHPLLNRAVMGAYTPGSIFKPVVALAGLESGRINPNRIIHCPGYFMLGNRRINCWLRRGHGDLDLHDAILYSCNVYFCTVGREIGHEAIAHMARALGLGDATGIGLHVERAGLVPDAAWKRSRHGESWWDGDTCNLSIGQGPVTVTPLQIALMTAAIANGGILYKPRLVIGVRNPGETELHRIPPRVANRVNWSGRTLGLVRQAMYDVVMSDRGTGRLARVPGIEIAGKTGTAEYGPKALNQKRGWMVAFAPYRQPRYAVAMVIDDAESGGMDVGPRLQRLFAELFDVTLPEEVARRG